MCRRYSAVFILALFVISVPPAGAQVAGPDTAAGHPRFDWARGGAPGPITGAAALSLRQGPLLDDPVMVAKRKALAAAEAGQAELQPSAVTPTPTVLLGKNGIFDPGHSPSDSTGAIGTKRYVEVVNSKVGIYDVNLKLIKQDTLTNWWSEPGASVFDPQVMWDPGTSRFYYAGDAVFSDTDNRLAFGFSKTDAPNNAVDDWCHYEIGYGAEFPDYPKLGDSKDFAIIGVNVFLPDSFRGSDILAVSKPPSGTTCPDPTTFKFGFKDSIVVGATTYFTPTPANGIDSNAAGWIVARPAALPATKIGLFKVTKDATTGNPVFPAGAAMTVPSYDAPPNAPQKDTDFTLDTMDARMTQAVAAIDPTRGNKFSVWTQHTIKGGAGAMVRWYEIDPAAKTLLQSGDVKNGSLYFFNGAISPDRVVKGGTKAFGGNMLLSFTASSLTTYPSLRMVAKRGADSTSAVKVVKSSPGPDIDFGCPINGYCRWGDYSAATPDPNAPTTGAAGIVWSTNMWTKDGRITGTEGTSWQTFNWKSQP